jgi:hypothetical protein
MTTETPVGDEKKSVLVPDGFPQAVFDKFQKELKSTPPRGLAFQNKAQRSTAFLQKGLMKPGKISYDTLRRAAISVHIVRICIQTLKTKITKTKWVIQNKEVTKRKSVTAADKARIKEVEDLFRHPNQNNETFRTLLDKMLEDLLALDAVSLEKTRYPNGDLAELFFVDSATIRPVYDDHGNQDIEIPLNTEKEGITDLPVSYVQVLDNSQFGGPESGEIVAAWPKKDFIHFHMNPQGAMESFGYGLSPIEGILSVVANILNADNFNSTYFEEGAFPPIVLQLIGQVNQRDLEAYREYLVSELSGNFHRPAIMATEKAESLQIHNLKDMTNRDMQFMEYQLWLAKLCTAMYGMSPEDIGLTDTTGSKSVSDVQKDLSEAKGYGSILHLLKEVFNQEIIWKDFGYEDLEFDWVAPDSQAPDESSQMYDRDLKNGSVTLNEVRLKRGESPYGDWADEPMLLTPEGYQPLDPKALAEHKDAEAERESPSEPEEVGGEKPYKEQKNSKAEGAEKMQKAMFTQGGYKTWFDDRGYGQPFICMDIKSGAGQVFKPPVAVNLQSQELEMELTNELTDMGLNVYPVQKMTYVEIIESLRNRPDVLAEFEKYCMMTPEYDSEKWKAKHGGSRKFPYYLVSTYIDGYSLNNPLLLADMARDPNSYRQAVKDLAKLWKAEKELILGDRRADQYIITHNKRAYGIDYQFKGDVGRWEKTKDAIQEELLSIPELSTLFKKETEDTAKGIIKRILSRV